MITPTLLRVGRYWHVRATVPDPERPGRTKRKQRSTGETVKARAWERALRIVEAWTAEAEGRRPTCTLRELVAEYLELSDARRSEAHWDAMERYARLHWGDLLDLDLRQITTTQVAAALNRYCQDHSEASALGWRRYLRLAFSWALETRRIEFIPWNQKALGKMKFKHVRPRPVLPLRLYAPFLEAFDAAVGVPGNPAADPRCLIVRLILGVGLRRSEVVRARWEWFDFDAGTIRPVGTKGGESLPRALPRALLDLLRPLAKPSGWAFPGPEGHPLHKDCCRRYIKAAAQAIGVHGIMHHRLRATVITHVERKAGVRVAQSQAAHKDPGTTLIYTERDPQLQREALEELWKTSGA